MPSNFANLTGAKGELVDRLLQALQRLEQRNPEWSENASLVICVVLSVPLEREHSGQIDRSDIYDRIGARMLEIVTFGVAEDFLVRAVRDRITSFLESQTDVVAINERREEFRQHILDLCSDPDRFRAYISSHHPGAPEAEWSNEKIRQEGEVFSAKEYLGPLTVDKVAGSWGATHFWADIISELISDAHIEHWHRQLLTRLHPEM